MDEERRALWRRRALFLGWIFVGATIVAGFFVASFFSGFSSIELGDPGAVLLLVPLLTGLLLGILLTDAEIVVAAGAGVACATIAVGLVAVFLFSPLLAGVAVGSNIFAAFVISRVSLSMVVVFPLVLVGCVLGRGVGDLFLPSPRLKRQLDELREETRRWHDALDRLERRQGNEPEAGGPKAPERKD
ncbi:MAG: hypothetical protein ACREDF_04650 [Thermoplasmata archaeon]